MIQNTQNNTNQLINNSLWSNNIPKETQVLYSQLNWIKQEQMVR